MVSKSFDVNSIPEINITTGEIKKSGRIISYENALNEIGFGKVQIVVLIVSLLVQANVLTETLGISFVIPGAVCDLNLSASDKGLLSSMSYLGLLIASHMFGFLADTQGRRIVVLGSILGSTISTLISVFMKNFTVFLILRFISGFCVAGYSAINYAYLGEFNSNKYRSSMITWVTTAVGVASVGMPLLAFWIMSYEWSFELYSGYFFRPWRLLLILYIIPGIIAFFGLLKLPESPKFLLTMSRNDEALDVVRWIHRVNKGKQSDGLNITQLELEPSQIVGRNYKGIKKMFMSIVDQTIPLFKPPYGVHFLACCSLHFGLFSVATGVAMFMPDILNKLAMAREQTGTDVRVCDSFKYHSERIIEEGVCNDSVDLNIYIQTIYVGIGYLVGFIVLAFVIRPKRRIPLLILNYSVAAISGLVLTFLTSQIAIIALFTCFVFFAGVNVPIVNSACVDIFPTYLRSMAVCCSMLFGRLGATISSNVLGYVLEDNCEVSFYAFVAICFICCGIALILPKPKEN